MIPLSSSQRKRHFYNPSLYIPHFFLIFRKVLLSFIAYFFAFWTKQILASNYIAQKIEVFSKQKLNKWKNALNLYSTLFFRLDEAFQTFSLCNTPHPLLLTFLRFDYHLFYEFTICLPKNPSILYWAIFLRFDNQVFWHFTNCLLWNT